MTEIAVAVSWARWVDRKLNPDRIEAVYVRGRSYADCARLITEHTRGHMSAPYLKAYALLWGNKKRPPFEGRGVWITRDHFDTELIPVWTDEPHTTTDEP